MNKAEESLADVRRWLCDNLSEGDAGKVCGMLSSVSRRIGELEDENAMMRELCKSMRMDMTSDPSLQESCMAALRHMGVEVRALIGKTNELESENAKLRDLVTYMYRCYVIGHDWGFYGALEKEHVEATMRELGIGVDG